MKEDKYVVNVALYPGPDERAIKTYLSMNICIPMRFVNVNITGMDTMLIYYFYHW